MTHLDIKEYLKNQQDALKDFAQVKLGIIDATREEDAASKMYIDSVLKSFAQMGWKAATFPVRPGETSIHDAVIRAITHKCTAILVPRPIREGVDFDPRMIPRMYDCDGARSDSFVNPSTPQGIVDYLDACGFRYEGRNALVLGRSEIAGKPMARMLLARDMTVSVAHSKSDPCEVSSLLQDADLVICATGQPHAFCRGQCLKAVVIDVGISRVDWKIVGDFEEDVDKCVDGAWSTPVPGGVGLLTQLALLKNCGMLLSEQ